MDNAASRIRLQRTRKDQSLTFVIKNYHYQLVTNVYASAV